MNILITGINGFVGSNFVNAWKGKHKIYGVDIVKKENDGIKQTFFWDEFNEIPIVDAIVHLAGKAHDTKNQSKAQVYFDVNTGLTQKIFDYFLQSEAKNFIYFSSVKAAADKVEGDILTEDIIPKPVGPYGESKIKAEEYILSKLDEAEKLNKSVYILRPCMIYGPGNKGNLNLLVNVVKKGIPWLLGAFENKRTFCSINNIAYVVENLATNEVKSGIYNVCDDETLSTNELIQLISEVNNKKTVIWKIPKTFINFISNVGTLIHLPLNNDRLQKLTENYVVSNEKIKKSLEIKSMPVKAEEAMKETLKEL